jgi:hypothetical protein
MPKSVWLYGTTVTDRSIFETLRKTYRALKIDRDPRRDWHQWPVLHASDAIFLMSRSGQPIGERKSG